MNLFFRIEKEWGSWTLSISDISVWKNFEKLARVNQHGLQGLWLKISNMNQRRQTILVIFISESVVLIIPNVANAFTKLNPPRGI